MSKEKLLSALEAILPVLTQLDLADAESAARTLSSELPLESESISLIRKLAELGAGEDWLLPMEKGAVRFGRLTASFGPFSVDAVLMSGPGPKHRHPRGEIDLAFAQKGSPVFDGHAEGWVVYGEGTAHIPTVSAGEMLILYFLPGGEIEWLRE